MSWSLMASEILEMLFCSFVSLKREWIFIRVGGWKEDDGKKTSFKTHSRRKEGISLATHTIIFIF